jgi:hypothetical protein
LFVHSSGSKHFGTAGLRQHVLIGNLREIPAATALSIAPKSHAFGKSDAEQKK